MQVRVEELTRAALTIRVVTVMTRVRLLSALCENIRKLLRLGGLARTIKSFEYDEHASFLLTASCFCFRLLDSLFDLNWGLLGRNSRAGSRHFIAL